MCIFYLFCILFLATYLRRFRLPGVAIIKALLHNRKAADLGPIICVCYTNHVLDQLLEHLVKDGVM